jgi:hypothetical protein
MMSAEQQQVGGSRERGAAASGHRGAGGAVRFAGVGADALLARAVAGRDVYEERARDVLVLRGERAALLRSEQRDVASRGLAPGVCLRRRFSRRVAVVVLPVSVTFVHTLDALVLVAGIAVWDVVLVCLERRWAVRARDADGALGVWGARECEVAWKAIIDQGVL